MSSTMNTLPHQRSDQGSAAAVSMAAEFRLLDRLRELGYDFTAPTPASQARVMTRADRRIGSSVADLLGWTLPCRPESIDPALLDALKKADLLEVRSDGLVRSHRRVSQVFGNLYFHSSYPTTAQDSIFLGPDSHRFADYIVRNMAGLPPLVRILDYGAGAGVGGITAATRHGNAMLTLADINPKALALASINAAFAGVEHQTVSASSPSEVQGAFDLIVTHPPFMIDPERRAYRDGGDLHGGRLSLEWTLAALNKLAPGGRLVMHTGVSIVEGRDVLFEALRDAMPATGVSYRYQLLDPDIFDDELDKPAYADVDRIAAIGLCVTRDAAEQS